MAKSENDDVDVILPNVSREELNRAAQKADEDAAVKNVCLINLAMTPCIICVGWGRGYKRIKVPPFGITPAMSRREAECYLAPPEVPSPGIITLRWVEQPKKHKPGKRDPQSFVDKHTNVTVPTSTWAPPKNEKMFGRTIHHSVNQAQHFMAKGLKTVPGVRRYITEFDNRPEVTQYATLVIDYFHKRAQEALGYGSDETVANV